MVTGAPFILTHTVNGSLPSCSRVLPRGNFCTPLGNVTGMGTLQRFCVAVARVTLTRNLWSSLKFHVSDGEHWSRAMRSTKACAMSSCFLVIMGQSVLGRLERILRYWENLQSHHLLGYDFGPDFE
jgi:hypothetical protein